MTSPADLSESPPGSKKLSVRMTASPSTPSNSHQIAARARSAGVEGASAALASGPLFGPRRRQRVPVDLAVGQQRQGVEGDVVLRQHVVGQVDTQMVLEGRCVEVAAAQDDIGHQGAHRRAVFARHDQALRDIGVRLQPGFDLARFDAMAAHLDLEVEPPLVL